MHLDGIGSISLSELEDMSLFVWLMLLFPQRLIAGCRGDLRLGEIGGWFVLEVLVIGVVMEMDFGSERVFLRDRLSKSGEFRLDVAG